MNESFHVLGGSDGQCRRLNLAGTCGPTGNNRALSVVHHRFQMGITGPGPGTPKFDDTFLLINP